MPDLKDIAGEGLHEELPIGEEADLKIEDKEDLDDILTEEELNLDEIGEEEEEK